MGKDENKKGHEANHVLPSPLVQERGYDGVYKRLK